MNTVNPLLSSNLNYIVTFLKIGLTVTMFWCFSSVFSLFSFFQLIFHWVSSFPLANNVNKKNKVLNLVMLGQRAKKMPF